MDFTSAHKEEIAMGEHFPFGVTPVILIGFSMDKTITGNEFMEIGFATIDGSSEDKARLYFTEKTAQFSFNTLRMIFVHNAPEDKKELARKTIDAVASTEKLVELLASKKSLQAWATKYFDAIRTYVGKDGNTYRSVNLNIYGYEPTLNESLIPKKTESVARAVSEVFGSESNTDQPWS